MVAATIRKSLAEREPPQRRQDAVSTPSPSRGDRGFEPRPLHRRVLRTRLGLDVQYDKLIFILEPSDQAKPAPGSEQGAAIGTRVTVVDYPDGRLAIRYRGVELVYRTFDKLRQVDQGAIADNKRLGAVLAMIRNQPLRRGGALSVTPACSRSAELLSRSRASWRSLSRPTVCF